MLVGWELFGLRYLIGVSINEAGCYTYSDIVILASHFYTVLPEAKHESLQFESFLDGERINYERMRMLIKDGGGGGGGEGETSSHANEVHVFLPL